MKYQGGGVVEESTEGSVGKEVSRDILNIIKKTGENILSMFESESHSESTSKTISSSENKMTPVETPVPAAQNRVVTLPTISAGQKGGEDVIPAKSDNDIPQFRVPIISHQRSMVVSTLGIADLMGGA